MNCRPDDLARIIKSNSGYTDRLVDVVRLFGVGPGHYVHLGPLWYVRPIGFTPHDCKLTPEGLFLFPDRLMRPIRNPGNDAVDEMVLRVGAPEGVTA
jgi:hypothetical protein